jgi:hypothetical protein
LQEGYCFGGRSGDCTSATSTAAARTSRTTPGPFSNEPERELDWRRPAMTEEQAAGIAPIWKVDGGDQAGHWAWEVELLGQARRSSCFART